MDELIVEANAWLDVIRHNLDALLEFCENAHLRQQLVAVRARIISQEAVIANLVQPNPAANQQQTSSSVSGGPVSSDSTNQV